MDPQTVLCHDSDCPARGQIGKGNIGVFSQKDRRYVCHVCNKTFAATGFGGRSAWLERSLGWTYAGGLLGWFIARSMVDEHSVLVLLLNQLGAWLFFPLLILGPWALVKRRRLSAAPLAIPAALFLWLYGPSFLPRDPLESDLNEPVTVLTFNLGYLNTDVEAIGASLMAFQADILALQEVTPFHAQHLQHVLAGRYAHHFYYAPAELAVYSYYPILTQSILPMEAWSAQSVVIQVRGASFHLINAHLERTGILRFTTTLNPQLLRDAANVRETQIVQILDAIHRTGLPAIVACDCNMTDLTSNYIQVTAALQDVHKERGWGLGHTFLIPRGFEIPSRVNLPAQRIDYLFHSPEIGVAKAEVGFSNGGSDHLPLLAQFDLRP